ncbi:MAG: phosphopyruvate hydratase [Anaerolineae bacterium]|nr:phosphopyruvate hydratase [Anaerolineae bacterium]
MNRFSALEILDSRGRPTVQCTCTLASGVAASASVPSGASTGTAEALELRDGDPKRYRGMGCRKAVQNINETIQDELKGQRFESQAALDRALLALDGTPNKSRLGANAILAVSMAFARASAAEQHIPLYQYFANILNQTPNRLPRPMINLFSGGKHAGGQVPIQDIQVMPLTASTMDEVLATTYEIFYTAAGLIEERYGMRMLTADEGGLAPDFASAEAMLDTAVEAIEKAGFKPGTEVALTVDAAASHFYADGFYHLGSEKLTGMNMVRRLLDWLDTYPIISLEDGLAENDWLHWSELNQWVASGQFVLGDDLLCTHPARIQQAIDRRAASALLLKVNQIGTLTEAAEAHQLAKSAGWRVVVSARSGETEDNWLADLAVGWSGDHIKVGAITQSERLAKYNRLLEIEHTTGLRLEA